MDDSGVVEVPVCASPASPKIEVVEDTGNASGNSSPSGRSSPEANCPICLGRPQNKSFTDSCLHQFCFACLQQWSQVKPECPLCKQSFKSIIHNVRSIEDYDQYQIRQATTETVTFGIQIREPFRYRTTMTADAFALINYSTRLEDALLQGVLPRGPSHSSGTHWLHRRRTGTGTSDFRRNIYQQGLWVQPLRDVTGRVRDCSPEFYRANPAALHRLMPWLMRELNVLLSNNNAAFRQIVSSRIIELVAQVQIRSSQFSEEMSQFIGRHTEHFVHELYCFASSPFDMPGYDRHANYVGRNSLAHDPYYFTDSDDSDVQVVEHYLPATVPIEVATESPVHVDSASGSDSDEVVVVETVAAPPPNVEVITLDSDTEEVVQVNIQINTEPQPQPGPSHTRPRPSQRPPVKLKRNWLLKNSQESNSGNLNVSINITHGSRSRSSSTSSSDSSGSWTPRRKAKKKKIEKPKKCSKGKELKSRKKSKPVNNRSPSPVVVARRRGSSVVLQSSSDEDSKEVMSKNVVKRGRKRSHPVPKSFSEGGSNDHDIDEVKRSRRRPVALRSPSEEHSNDNNVKEQSHQQSSALRLTHDNGNGSDIDEVKQVVDNDSDRLHIVTDYSSSSSEEYKPRVRSVVIKPEVTTDCSPTRPQSPTNDGDSNSGAPARIGVRSFDLDRLLMNVPSTKPQCSSWHRPPSSSHRRPSNSSSSEHSNKKIKHCKKRCKKLTRE